ncbi:MAG TPA: S-adenosylmethionine:tRNA ribosyltransferase-isomerase, partial [Deinococcales bacterium]|nr:S-adenosylmethionine:tRNA ribosyltransferase-isomerase [Deinococcales bacterium]
LQLPPQLEAGEPPEERGLRRDEVRLLASYRSDDSLRHARFRDLPDLLAPGDLLVINTSATIPAALTAQREGGQELELHLSTHLPAGLWTVELRLPSGFASLPCRDGRPGERLALPGGASALLHAPYRRDGDQGATGGSRLWIASLDLPAALLEYLARHGRPVRYQYARAAWGLDAYQTVYADEPGSAEMPSAGRAFTTELITRLVARGVDVAPLVLHTGLASLEDHEPPYEEHYRVPEATARRINAARAGGGRVIAVGTTVVRALETVAASDGQVHPGEGWTGIVITPERPVRAVDGLITGWHEPKATHLAMLEAIAGRQHLAVAYRAALENGYLWHEFGDLHIILP